MPALPFYLRTHPSCAADPDTDRSMNLQTFTIAILFIAYSPFAISANAQNPQKTDCVVPQSMKADQLHGRWAVQFTNPPAGLPARATMLLQRHAEFSESLAGTLSRDLGKNDRAGTPAVAGHSARAALAGDLDEGLLLLDESSDNISITGTWNGEMKPGSCGRVYQGRWKDTSPSAAPDAADVPFTLTKLP